MKKIYILIITLISLQAFSQKDYNRYYNSWRLGLNMGAAWQTADYRSCYGMGGGLTLEKGFHENSTNIFSFAIRGRYLGANTYGMDFNRNYDIKTNDAYNGKYNPKVNYIDTVHTGRNYVYDNYKMTLGEGSLELQLTFNRLRERSHVLLNLWGGVGITSFKTKSDLLDANGKMYDFSLVDSTGNQTKALSSYNSIIDNKYESDAYGSKAGNLITFSPSAGIGLGYQFGPGFSMLFEYKVTFPQGTNADLLDGRLGTNKDMIAGSNDYYHYAGLNLLFTLRGKKKNPSTANTNQTAYTNTVVGTNTTVPTNSLVTTNTVITTNTVVSNTPPTEPKPIITYITPPVNGHVVYNHQYKISAQILNVTSPSQIQFKLNGITYPGFTFNAQNHILEFNANLNTGNNPIQIIATNSVGSDNKSTSVIYELPKPSGTPPVITIVNPGSCPYNATTKSYNFRAVVANVSQKSNITVKVNNALVSNFSFNTTTGQLDLPLNLFEGVNKIDVSAFNNFGNDSKNCSINYSAPKQVGPPPVVTYINPAQPGYVSNVPTYVVVAQVLNVTGQNSISVYYNGMSTPFVYNPTTKQVSFTANLNVGSNSISITANNPNGEDTKETSVVFKENVVTGPPPVVNLLNPATATNTSSNLSYNFKLVVLNVTSKNDITLTFNGASTSNFTYDVNTKEIFFQSNLNVGNNTLVVKGTNAFGVDSKTVNVSYMPFTTAKFPPVITINNPMASPGLSSVANFIYKASVTNISSKSQLVVKYNGNVVTNFAFIAPNIVYPATLVNGNNVLEITATNNDGSDFKNAIVTFEQKVAMGKPPVVNLINPALQMNATNNMLYNFKLSVLNVSAKSDVELLFNGVAQSNFTYNVNTKEVFFQTNLVVGNNTVVVKGTNPYGVDSKTVIVNYTPQVQAKLPPVVTITNPLVSPGSSTNPNYTFKATITNVPNTSGLVVKYNGIVITNYTYDGFNLNYPATLVQGNNSFEVAATNNDGSDSKTAIVNYRQKAAGAPPIVSLVNPAMKMNATDNLLYNFKLSVINVNSIADIELLFNGVAQSNFTYDINTKEVFFQTNLVVGDNIVSVKGTNAFGVDSKTVHVNYTPHDNIKLPPIITFINPANLSGSSPSNNYVYKATIANMINSNNIVVKHNGTAVTNFTFDGLNLTYPATLNNGSNSLEITATNNDGTDTKTAIVNYRPKTVAKPPVVSILNPVGTPTVNVSTYSFQFRVFYATQNQITVTLNGSAVTSYNFASNVGSFVGNLNQGTNVLSVSATNADGSDSKTESVVYVVATNTVSVPTPTTPSTPTTVTTPTVNGNEGKTLTICHIPPGNTGNPQTITIPISAWPAHQAHGDVIGTCSVATTPTTATTPTVGGNQNSTMTICHIPPGNTGNPQTITIPVAAWPAHQAHGDVIGTCSVATTPTTATTPTVGGNQNSTMTICHIPPGNTGNPQTITIPASAWPAHQAHGDVIGTCSVATTPTTASTPTVNTTPADTNNGKITICHIPPGNNQNPQTISIPLSAWPAHQAHGDVMGACPSEKTVPVKTNPRINPVNPNNQNKKTESDSTKTQPINTPRRPR